MPFGAGIGYWLLMRALGTDVGKVASFCTQECQIYQNNENCNSLNQFHSIGRSFIKIFHSTLKNLDSSDQQNRGINLFLVAPPLPPSWYAAVLLYL